MNISSEFKTFLWAQSQQVRYFEKEQRWCDYQSLISDDRSNVLVLSIIWCGEIYNAIFIY